MWGAPPPPVGPRGPVGGGVPGPGSRHLGPAPAGLCAVGGPSATPTGRWGDPSAGPRRSSACGATIPSPPPPPLSTRPAVQAGPLGQGPLQGVSLAGPNSRLFRDSAVGAPPPPRPQSAPSSLRPPAAPSPWAPPEPCVRGPPQPALCDVGKVHVPRVSMGIVVHPELGGAAPRPLPPPPRPMLDLGGPRLIVGHTSGPGPMRRPGGRSLARRGMYRHDGSYDGTPRARDDDDESSVPPQRRRLEIAWTFETPPSAGQQRAPPTVVAAVAAPPSGSQEQ